MGLGIRSGVIAIIIPDYVVQKPLNLVIRWSLERFGGTN